MEPAVVINNLRKVFKLKQKAVGFKSSLNSLFKPKFTEIVAVNDISLKINIGETVAFIGPNGAGKSTTIKMLTGILYPTSGEISVLGLDPAKERTKLAFKIGTVFGQKSQLWYHLPAIDTFFLLSKIYELKEAEYQKRLKFLVEVLEIGNLLDIPVRKLSLGQRTRCEIAASLLHNPKILFLDEPTIGLDVVAKQHVRDIVNLLNEKEGVTIFLTSHDAGDVEAITKRTVIINHGKIVFDGDTRYLRRKYITTKIIEIIVEDSIEKFDFDHGKILEKNNHSIKIEIDTQVSSIEKLLEYSLENFKVLDMNIVSPPLEEIITNIYGK